MSGKRIAFGAKPAAPTADAWVQQGNGAETTVETPPQGVAPKADIYTARLTIDVTPELRGRIKDAPFSQGVTDAEMVRDIHHTSIPHSGVDP